MSILVAHPLKHHAFNLAYGCEASGVPTQIITPLYKKGIFEYLSKVPGPLGKKIQGYSHPKLDDNNVIAPMCWGIKRIFCPNRKIIAFQVSFDLYVAKLLSEKVIRPKVLVTLQDYMPKTVEAAAKQGVLIWSDQILNRSARARDFLKKNLKLAGLEYIDQYSEFNNNNILGVAKIVTSPSQYVEDGIEGRTREGCIKVRVPYGVDAEKFSSVNPDKQDKTIRILARANNVRKGGHLLMAAIEEIAEELLGHVDGFKVEINIIGILDAVVKDKLKRINLPSEIIISSKIVPHVEMADEFLKSDIFVMPSLSEGMSLMCLEAMQMGLPLVVTRECGLDCFRSGEMGLIVEPTVSSISVAMIEAFKRRSEWPAWSQECKKTADLLSWDSYEKDISQVCCNNIL